MFVRKYLGSRKQAGLIAWYNQGIGGFFLYKLLSFIFWISILSVIFYGLYLVREKQTHFEKRLDNLDKKIDSRFETIDSKIDSLLKDNGKALHSRTKEVPPKAL